MKPEITSEDRIPKEKNNFAQEIVQVACDPKQFPLFLARAGYRSKFPNAAMFIALAWWFTKYRMCPIILHIFPILFHKLQLHKYRNTFFLSFLSIKINLKKGHLTRTIKSPTGYMCEAFLFCCCNHGIKTLPVKCIYSVIKSLYFLSQPAEKTFAFNLGCWVCSKSKN